MTLHIDLLEEEADLLNAKADAEGVSTERYAQQLLKQALSLSTARPPLTARIRELWKDMPEEVRTKLPSDGASQHDHHIYGVPKREL